MLSHGCGGWLSPTATRDTGRAMPQENVEVVRRFYEVLNEWLTSYWSDPEQPLDQSSGVEKVFRSP